MVQEGQGRVSITMNLKYKDTRFWLGAKNLKFSFNYYIFDKLSKYILRRKNFRLIVVAGLKRSGNHAVLNWILSQSKGHCLFWNHIDPNQYPTDRHRREYRIKSPFEMPTVIFSYEDREINDIFNGELFKFISYHHEKIHDRHFCIILREPKNMVASRFRKWEIEYLERDRIQKILSIYKSYSSAPFEKLPDESFEMTPVYFDDFISSSSHRDAVSDRLGIRRGIRGLNKVTSYGHGSSFSGTSKISSKDVLSRDSYFSDDPVFNELFSDDSLSAVAENYRSAAPRF